MHARRAEQGALHVLYRGAVEAPVRAFEHQHRGRFGPTERIETDDGRVTNQLRSFYGSVARGSVTVNVVPRPGRL